MTEPSYFGLTNDHTWLSVDEESYKKLKPTYRMKCYTHLVKELTDEEIMQVCSQIEPFDDTTIEQAFIEFARAILKKASEK